MMSQEGNATCCLPLFASSSSESDSEEKEDSAEDVVDLCKDPSRCRVDGLLDSGMLKEYTTSSGTVDCSKAIPVYVDVSPQELKSLDDGKEEFAVVFVLKFWWLDRKLKDFQSKLTLEKEDETSGRVYLQEIDVVVRSLDKDGTLQYEELPLQQVPRVLKATKDMYTYLEPPKWEHHFFPDFSFINQETTDEQVKTKVQQLVWCDKDGALVHYKAKYDTIFQEFVELHAFPLDRQLCRIKLTAEMGLDQFQLITLNSNRKLARLCDMWEMPEDLGRPGWPCTVYVRHPDTCLQDPVTPRSVDEKVQQGHSTKVTQRSLVNVVLHVQRKPSFFVHSILLMVSLVNAISLCAFALKVDDAGSRLGYLSTCFLAVLAYRYIINDSLPKKSYMTAAGWFITLASFYQTWLCFETAFLAFWWSHSDENIQRTIEICDWALGSFTFIAWLLFILFYWYQWRISTWRPSWQEVYQKNQEPYCPLEKCDSCQRSWLAKQSAHLRQNKTCPKCQGRVQTTYLTPLDREKPLIPSLRNRGFGNEVESYLLEFG